MSSQWGSKQRSGYSQPCAFFSSYLKGESMGISRTQAGRSEPPLCVHRAMPRRWCGWRLPLCGLCLRTTRLRIIRDFRQGRFLWVPSQQVANGHVSGDSLLPPGCSFCMTCSGISGCKGANQETLMVGSRNASSSVLGTLIPLPPDTHCCEY